MRGELTMAEKLWIEKRAKKCVAEIRISRVGALMEIAVAMVDAFKRGAKAAAKARRVKA